MRHSIWIGFDRREASAFAVAKHSTARRLTLPVPIFAIELEQLRRDGVYTRESKSYQRAGKRPVIWDTISGAPMSTEFAISRFLTPHLAGSGWALFMDGDVLVRKNISRLFELADPTKALMCVQHPELPDKGPKMDQQIQLPYSRKNWSSVMLFNVDHPANKALTIDLINSAPGRDLHRFCWLQDSDIGAIPPEWNWLAGHSDPQITDPAIVHFTDGFPLMDGYEHVPFADEWNAELRRWARADRWPAA